MCLRGSTVCSDISSVYSNTVIIISVVLSCVCCYYKNPLLFFSKPFNKDVLCHYVDLFNLTGMHLVDALR